MDVLYPLSQWSMHTRCSTQDEQVKGNKECILKWIKSPGGYSQYQAGAPDPCLLPDTVTSFSSAQPWLGGSRRVKRTLCLTLSRLKSRAPRHFHFYNNSSSRQSGLDNNHTFWIFFHKVEVIIIFAMSKWNNAAHFREMRRSVGWNLLPSPRCFS